MVQMEHCIKEGEEGEGEHMLKEVVVVEQEHFVKVVRVVEVEVEVEQLVRYVGLMVEEVVVEAVKEGNSRYT